MSSPSLSPLSAPAPAGQLPLPLLAVLVAGAAAVHQLVLLVPLAIALGLPALLFGNTAVLAAAGAVFVWLAWGMQPQAGAAERLRRRVLTRQEVPAAYRWLDALSQRVDGPRGVRLALDDEPGVQLLVLHRAVSLRPSQPVLVLGLPLLAQLDLASLEALVAQQLSHFGRAQRPLARWVFGARQAWLRRLDALASHGPTAWEQASAALTRRFVPWLARHSEALAEQVEQQARQQAQQRCGLEVLAEAVARCAAAKATWQHLNGAGLRALQRQWPEPPGERLRQLATEHAPCAGAALLGALWQQEAGGFDHDWAQEHLQRWRMQHAAFQVLGAGGFEHHLVWATFQRAQALLQGVQAREALAPLQQCVEVAPTWAVPVRSLMAEHARALGLDSAARGRNQVLLDKALQRRHSAAAAMFKAAGQGRFDPADLPRGVHAALAAALAAHPAVQAGWCVGLRTALDERRTYCAVLLIVRLAPQVLASLGQSDETVGADLRALLSSLLLPDVLCLVWPSYTTEALHPLMAARLQDLPASQLIAPC